MPYICKICGKEFNSITQLIKHLQEEHCETCNKNKKKRKK